MDKIKNILISKDNKEFIDKLDLPLSKFFNFILDDVRNKDSINTIKRRFYNDRTTKENKRTIPE